MKQAGRVCSSEVHQTGDAAPLLWMLRLLECRGGRWRAWRWLRALGLLEDAPSQGIESVPFPSRHDNSPGETAEAYAMQACVALVWRAVKIAKLPVPKKKQTSLPLRDLWE
ncbi:hypothetical protein CLOM_g21260 [Closterium sp. NIES-68]|nr:hypothetical protein CLOM_g21260 [Closterium sp. NIES-68]